MVKLGGAVLNQELLQEIASLQKKGRNLVLVHGGGQQIDNWQRLLKKKPKFINGLRITDPESLQVVVAVLAGLVNKQLVAGLNSFGANAVGISGVDGSLIRGKHKDPTLGEVGEVVEVDKGLLLTLIANGFLPVISSLGFELVGEKGQILNINADSVAAEVAISLEAKRLIFLTGGLGILGKGRRLIESLPATDARALLFGCHFQGNGTQGYSSHQSCREWLRGFCGFRQGLGGVKESIRRGESRYEDLL